VVPSRWACSLVSVLANARLAAGDYVPFVPPARIVEPVDHTIKGVIAADFNLDGAMGEEPLRLRLRPGASPSRPNGQI
jgi:hypothetical protein